MTRRPEAAGVIEELVASARARARNLPREEPEPGPWRPSLADVLRGKERLDVIAEFKRKSPSLGPLAERDLEAWVKRYVEAGARAVSVLTEPTRFGGSVSDLERAASAVSAPVLMKDFIVDPAQVREAARRGARSVLLIVRCLSRDQLRELSASCSHYRLTPLVECHHASELELALELDGAVIGVNNRDLDTFEIDRELAPSLLRVVPPDRVVVAESGYETAEETRELRGLADAVLIGSALMKLDDPAVMIREIGS